MKCSSRKKKSELSSPKRKIVSIIHCRAFRGADSSPSMESCKKTFSASRGIYNCCCYVDPKHGVSAKKRRKTVEVHIGGCAEVIRVVRRRQRLEAHKWKLFLRKLRGFVGILKLFSFLSTWLTDDPRRHDSARSYSSCNRDLHKNVS